MTTISSTHLFYSDNDPALADTSVMIDRDNSHIILGKNLLTTPQYITISPNSISNGSASTTFGQIANLSNALASVELPPNPSTLQLNNRVYLVNTPTNSNSIDIDASIPSISVSDSSTTTTITQNNITTTNVDLTTINGMSPTTIGLTWADFDPNNAWGHLPLNQYGLNDYLGNQTFWQLTRFTMEDTIGGYFARVNQSNFQLTNNNSGFNGYLTLIGTDSIGLDTGAGTAIIGDANGSNHNTKLLVNDNHREIDLNAVDIMSNCGSSQLYTLPIQFTNKYSSNYNYGTSGTWFNVASNVMNMPSELFTLTAGSTDWKVDFAINCWNMSNQSDKSYAMYVDILDSSNTPYYGFLFNQSTPFTTHKNDSTYGNTNSHIENYIYTDYFSLNGASGSPFTINLWLFADNPISCDFNWLLTLSKTNLV